MTTDTIKKWIENGIHELGIEVEFDYSPSEPATRTYPGCGEQLDICDVKLVVVNDDCGHVIEFRNDEICLLPDFEKLLAEEILDDRYNSYYDYDC